MFIFLMTENLMRSLKKLTLIEIDYGDYIVLDDGEHIVIEGDYLICDSVDIQDD